MAPLTVEMSPSCAESVADLSTGIVRLLDLRGVVVVGIGRGVHGRDLARQRP